MGLTSADGQLPTQLNWADTAVQSTAYCQQQANDKFDAPFDSTDQTCAIDPPGDSTGICSGDSGGPLLAQGANDTLVEIGINSWTATDCSTQTPGYFMRTDVISNWVNNWIQAVAPPTTDTSAATNIHPVSAQLNGALDPNGFATNYYFQYGTSAAYGSRVGAGSTNNGGTSLAVNAALTRLAPGALYHYRLVASNTNGTVAGADQTFTTPPAPLPGKYRGRTSQRWPITIDVAANRYQLAGLSFSFTMRCTRHRPLSYTFTPTGSGYWPRKLSLADGFGIIDSFRDSENTRYRLEATFGATGGASGTLSATWLSARYGTCRTGAIRWHATR